MQATGRHPHKFCHGPIYSIAKTFAGGVQVVEAAAAHGVIRIYYGSRLAYYPVALFPASDAAAYFCHMAAKFMTQHNRVVYWPAMIGSPLVEVAATNAYIGYFQQYIVFSDSGFVYFTYFNRAFFRSIVYNSKRFHIGNLKI
jgi:hypothetical protein